MFPTLILELAQLPQATTVLGPRFAAPQHRRALAAVPLAVVAVTVALVVVLAGAIVVHAGHLDALRAAGAFDGAGSAIGGLNTFISKITGNLIWLVSAGAILAVMLIGGMFLSGHSRAGDYAIRAGLGFAIVAGASGIVA